MYHRVYPYPHIPQGVVPPPAHTSGCGPSSRTWWGTPVPHMVGYTCPAHGWGTPVPHMGEVSPFPHMGVILRSRTWVLFSVPAHGKEVPVPHRGEKGGGYTRWEKGGGYTRWEEGRRDISHHTTQGSTEYIQPFFPLPPWVHLVLTLAGSPHCSTVQRCTAGREECLGSVLRLIWE